MLVVAFCSGCLCGFGATAGIAVIALFLPVNAEALLAILTRWSHGHAFGAVGFLLGIAELALDPFT